MIRNMLTAVAFLGAVVAACSSDDDFRYPSTDAFCSAKADAECTNVAAPCGKTASDCKTARSAACTSSANTATSQGRKYKPPSADGCIDKTKALYELRTIPPEKETEQREVCERVFEGSKARNERCSGPYDCQASLVCDKGVCATKVVKNLDDPCANPGEVCATGAYCGTLDGLMRCLAKKDRDQLCGPDAPCKESLRCVGTCRDKFNAGDVCGASEECADAAPYCDPVQKRCVAKTFSAGNAACGELGL